MGCSTSFQMFIRLFVSLLTSAFSMLTFKIYSFFYIWGFLYIRNIDFVVICKHFPAFCHTQLNLFMALFFNPYRFKHIFLDSQLHYLFALWFLAFPTLRLPNYLYIIFYLYLSNKNSNPFGIYFFIKWDNLFTNSWLGAPFLSFTGFKCLLYTKFLYILRPLLNHLVQSDGFIIFNT